VEQERRAKKRGNQKARETQREREAGREVEKQRETETGRKGEQDRRWEGVAEPSKQRPRASFILYLFPFPKLVSPAGLTITVPESNCCEAKRQKATPSERCNDDVQSQAQASIGLLCHVYD